MYHRVILLFYLASIGLVLWACGAPAPTPTTTPDLVATEVAVRQAAAATLTAQAQPSSPSTPTPTPTQQPVSDTLPTNTPTAASTTGAAPTNTPPLPQCTVVTAGLNLRPGPGTIYEPALGALAAGAELSPLTFFPTGFPTGQWLEVQVQATGQTGWVSAEPQFISCNIDLATIPPGVAPPTPTAAPLPPTNTPSPTPTRPLFAVLPVDGDSGNQSLRGSEAINEGRYVILPGYAPGSVSSPPVFRDQMVLRVEVFDPEHGGNSDGDGIRNVKFTLTKNGEGIYDKVENTAGYCAFGGGEPDCQAWVFAEHNYQWPNGWPIENGPHRAVIEITPQQGDQATWNWDFNIDGVPSGQTNLVAQIVQTGPNSDADVVYDALVFQVEAYNPAVGNHDGAGIDRVDLRIIGTNGEVYQRTEQNAAYCAFSGGEPDCNIWVFADHDNEWPSGHPIEPGNYMLQATVYAEDGNSTTVQMTIQILE